jgi:hypothetical protein
MPRKIVDRMMNVDTATLMMGSLNPRLRARPLDFFLCGIFILIATDSV